jgi:hypothetical protein
LAIEVVKLLVKLLMKLYQTGQIGKLAGPLKDDLFSFLGKYGGSWEENQVAKKLAHLLSEGRVANFPKKLSHEEG